MSDPYGNSIPSISGYMNVPRPGLNATNKQMANYHKRRAEALDVFVAQLEISSFPINKESWSRRLQEEINESLRYGQLAISDEIEILRNGKRPQTTYESIRDPENVPTQYLDTEANFYDCIGEHNVANRFRNEIAKRRNYNSFS